MINLKELTPRMSLPERQFQNEGYMLLKLEMDDDVNVDAMMFERVTFNIPGGKYTPDFMVVFSDGHVCFVEVKQEGITKAGKKYYAGRSSYRDSRSKLRATASLNPWFTFYMAVYFRGGWRLEKINQDPWIDPFVIPKEEP